MLICISSIDTNEHLLNYGVKHFIHSAVNWRGAISFYEEVTLTVDIMCWETKID